MSEIRVKDQTEATTYSGEEYILLDDATSGTKKITVNNLLGEVKEDIAQLDGLSDDIKSALMAVVNHVAWNNTSGQQYIDALESALYPSATLDSISAVYTQSGTVYIDDSLEDLRTDLVVTAHYSDSTTATVTTYTLSGTLVDGDSTVTVAYGGKTTTITVNATAPLYSIPDFAEQTVTVSGRSQTVKKENGYYTMTGTYGDVVYIYPDGTAHTSKSNTLWFATPNSKPITHEIFDITWDNPNSMTVDLACKFSQSNTTGNKATATYQMTANGSGTEGSATFVNESYATANFSAYGIQLTHSGTNYSNNVTVTFKMRLFCDGVRYL